MVSIDRQLVSSVWRMHGGDLCKAELKKIQCPTLILHGDQDALIPLYQPVYLQQNITGARLHRYPDGKHAIHISYAEHLNNLAMQFLLEWANGDLIKCPVLQE